MKTLILAAIRCSLMLAAVAALSVQPVQAYTVRLEQAGSNVVATGSGAINLTGLTLSFDISAARPTVHAHSGEIVTGGQPGMFTPLDEYLGVTGPTSFGSGGVVLPNTASGDIVGIIDILGALIVPDGYVSGTALSSTATWNSATFASLGVIPGTYTWTWGTTGGANQKFILQIGPATVPDGGSTVSLLGCALLGLAALRRKFCC